MTRLERKQKFIDWAFQSQIGPKRIDSIKSYANILEKISKIINKDIGLEFFDISDEQEFKRVRGVIESIDNYKQFNRDYQNQIISASLNLFEKYIKTDPFGVEQKHSVGSFDSWDILSKTVAIKNCDKSFFDHNGSGVPKDICWFFDAENIPSGQTKSIVLNFCGKDYSARVKNDSTDRRRIQIFWRSDLGKLFAEHRNDTAPQAQFTKIADGKYEVSFIGDSPSARKAWLLSWNPNNWNWEDFDNAVRTTRAGNSYQEPWSCANTHVALGDRVFLIMLGMGEENGIVASGYASSGSYEDDHWDAEKQAHGVKVKRIDVSFDWIADYRRNENLKQNELKRLFPDQQWSPQGSGIEIKPQYIDPLETQWDIVKNQSSGGEETLTPKETIDKIKAYIEAKGFTYEDGLIENFYLSLKSKPFVILAGTSGTGKTRLVKLFAEAIGAAYELVSVQPNWSDGSDLFGHTDLNGRFIPGPVCAAFDTAISEPEKPVFLCLDEMNLARVEYYLSDFLSVIESREKENGHIVTEGIAQYANGIPENLYIIGTVNMDETTFPFSKKVLDRANTIEFSYVDLIPKQITDETPDPLQLPNSFLRTEYLVLAIDCIEDKEFDEKICTELQSLNVKLVKANAHVGYRVRDEIVFYMLNNKNAGDLLTYEQAMDNEIMQKILPRIQGSSAAIKSLLIDMFKFCMGSGSGIDPDTGNVGEQMKAAADSAKYPESAKKIGYMMSRFEDDGFTSYWL